MNMITRLSVTFILPFFFVSASLTAQIFYCTNGRGKSIGEVKINNCIFDFKGHSEVFSDITFHPNGKFYGLIGVNNLTALVEIDVEKEIFVDTLVYVGGFGATSLTCSKNGLFYLGHNHLYSYNMETDSLSNLGIFPDDQGLAGDLVFFNGDLLGGTYNVFQSGDFRNIYKIDMEDPLQSEKVFQFSLQQQFAVGMAVTHETIQDKNNLIISYFDRSDAGRDTSFLHQIDLIDSTSTELCRIDLSETVFSGLASTDELRTNFHLQLDLDSDNSSGRYIDHYEDDTRCTYEYPITDEDVTITTVHSKIDSMVIVVQDDTFPEGTGLLKGEVDESLFSLVGNQSTQLTYRNLGMATHEDVITALKSVRFYVTEDEPQHGEREVRVYLYADGTVSDGSRAFLDINFTPLVAGEDGYLATCPGGFGNGTGMDGHLFLSLGGEPDEGGHWEPETFFGNGVINIDLDTSATYQYIVQEGVCPADTAEVEFYRIPDPDITLGEDENGDIFLCQGDSLVWDITIPNPREYYWDDGTEEPIRVIKEAGDYAGGAMNSDGCFTLLEVEVIMLPDSNRHSTEVQLLCQGDSYSWQGQSITSDTILCEQYALLTGCDSIHCIDVRFFPSYQEVEQLNFCRPDTFWWQGEAVLQDTLICVEEMTVQGCDSTVCYDLRFFEEDYITEPHVFTCGQAEYEVDGVSFEQDTSFCFNYQNVGGCDSVRCIVAEIVPIPTTNIETEICFGDTVRVGNETFTAGGVYDVLLEGQAGCDSMVHLLISMLPFYQQTIDTALIAGEQIEIGEEIFTETGTYEINLLTEENCDSTILLNLTVLNSTTNITSNSNDFYGTSLINAQQQDVFKIFSSSHQTAHVQTIRVLDTWGRVIFNQKDLHEHIGAFEWKANANGNALTSGIYWYQISLKNEKDKLVQLLGKIVVM